MIRTADETVTRTDRAGVTRREAVLHLGAWEQGALQVLLDAVRGEWDSALGQALVESLVEAQTTLGADAPAVIASLDHLGGLVRAFSQADAVTITASTRDR